MNSWLLLAWFVFVRSSVEGVVKGGTQASDLIFYVLLCLTTSKMGLFSYIVAQGVCWGAPSLGYLIGFGVAGPVGGSIAAAAQASIGAAVASGSYFSLCQSVAMAAAAAPLP